MSQKDHKQSAAAAGEHARGALGEGAAAIEELVNAAADFLSPKVRDAGQKVAPLVSDAYDKVSPHLATAGDKVGPYYEKTRDKFAEGYENVLPRIQEILDRAADSDYAAKAGKLADTASGSAQAVVDRAGKALQETVDSATRNAQQAAGKAAEHAQDSAAKAAAHAQDGAAKAAAHAQDGAAKAAGTAKKTSRKARAKAEKAAKKAAKIASAAAAAELARARKDKHRGRNRLFTVLGIVAVVGALVVAVRQLLMPRDDGWTPREPSKDFDDDDVTTDFSAERVDDLTTPATDQASAEGIVHDTPVSTAHGEDEDAVVTSEDSHLDAADPSVPTTEPDVESNGAETLDEAEDVWTGEGGPARAADEPKDFGPDSYVGDNPPEGFTIKGNQRSMKYHTPDGAGFARTNADVWFSSEEAAEAAGFTKASR
ncbi:MAG: hypothetical protein WAX29_04090 [Propionibacterium sp.]